MPGSGRGPARLSEPPRSDRNRIARVETSNCEDCGPARLSGPPRNHRKESHAWKLATARPACVYSLVSPRRRPDFAMRSSSRGEDGATCRTQAAQIRARTATPRRRKINTKSRKEMKIEDNPAIDTTEGKAPCKSRRSGLYLQVSSFRAML